MSATQMSVQYCRDVVRCDDCTLVQFITRSGLCRKCHAPYVSSEPVPESAPAPAPIAALPAEQQLGAAEAARQLLRVIRLAHSYNQKQWGDALGVTRQYIHKSESCGVDPTLRIIERICSRLGMQLPAFMAAVDIAAHGSAQ